MSTAPTHRRRWHRRPAVTLCEVVVWAAFTALIAAILIVLCVLLTLAMPS